MPDLATPTIRIELNLTKPPLGWYPRPTVVVDGRGHPAQWGTGTWQLEPGATIGVYLFNRLWRFGAATTTADGPGVLRYRAPWLPVGGGRITAV